MPINLFSEASADTFDLAQLVHRGRVYLAQAAEVRQEALPSLGADSRNFIQRRGGARLSAPCAVADNREPVRLVADALNEMQAGVLRRKNHAALLRFKHQLLEPRPALRALGDTNHADIVQAELDQRRLGGADLTLAAVNENQIRNLARLRRYALVAPRKCLAHRRVVVTGGDVSDVIPSVLALLHRVMVVYHAGGDCGLSHRVTDIETFDSFCRGRQGERVAKGDSTRLLSGALALTMRDCQLCVLARHVEPDAALAVDWHGNLRRSRRVLAQHRFESRAIKLVAGQYERGHGLIEIMLLEKGRKHFTSCRPFGILWKEAAVPDVPPSPDHDQVDACNAALHYAGHYIRVNAALAFDVLACLHSRQSPNLITVDCRFLVEPCRRCSGHLLRKRSKHVGLPAFEEEHRVVHVLGISIRAYEARTGCGTASDLVKQAGARAGFEHAVFTGPQPEYPLQKLSRIADGVGVRKGAEIPVATLLRAAVKPYAGDGMAGDHQVRIGLIVTEQDVVARRQTLDEVVLQQEGFGFGASCRHLDRGDLRQHHPNARANRSTAAEVGSDALLEVARLAYVQGFAARA